MAGAGTGKRGCGVKGKLFTARTWLKHLRSMRAEARKHGEPVTVRFYDQAIEVWEKRQQEGSGERSK